MTRENKILIPLSVASGVLSTAAGFAVACVAEALTFGELWLALIVLFTIVFGCGAAVLTDACLEPLPKSEP